MMEIPRRQRCEAFSVFSGVPVFVEARENPHQLILERVHVQFRCARRNDAKKNDDPDYRYRDDNEYRFHLSPKLSNGGSARSPHNSYARSASAEFHPLWSMRIIPSASRFQYFGSE